jgi:low affinity Fe/Cu permease
MLAKTASSILTNLGALSAKPIAFLTVIAYGSLWLIFQRETLNWHGVATLATWMMTLFIQRSEHRDTQALHAKIDDLLRANHEARAGLTKIDKREPEEIERYRDRHNDQGD